jgi:hypothetical protein
MRAPPPPPRGARCWTPAGRLTGKKLLSRNIGPALTQSAMYRPPKGAVAGLDTGSRQLDAGRLAGLGCVARTLVGPSMLAPRSMRSRIMATWPSFAAYISGVLGQRDSWKGLGRRCFRGWWCHGGMCVCVCVCAHMCVRVHVHTYSKHPHTNTYMSVSMWAHLGGGVECRAAVH